MSSKHAKFVGDKIKSKIKIKAPIIFSIRKLQLPASLTFVTHDTAAVKATNLSSVQHTV